MQFAHGSQKDYKMHIKRKIPYVEKLKSIEAQNQTSTDFNGCDTKIVK